MGWHNAALKTAMRVAVSETLALPGCVDLKLTVPEALPPPPTSAGELCAHMPAPLTGARFHDIAMDPLPVFVT